MSSQTRGRWDSLTELYSVGYRPPILEPVSVLFLHHRVPGDTVRCALQSQASPRSRIRPHSASQWSSCPCTGVSELRALRHLESHYPWDSPVLQASTGLLPPTCCSGVWGTFASRPGPLAPRNSTNPTHSIKTVCDTPLFSPTRLCPFIQGEANILLLSGLIREEKKVQESRILVTSNIFYYFLFHLRKNMKPACISRLSAFT